MQARHPLSRRNFLTVGGVMLASLSHPRIAPARNAVRKADGYRILTARPGRLALQEAGQALTDVWSYDGQVPGPLLRLTQGRKLQLRLHNDLDQPTGFHWHGLSGSGGHKGLQPLVESGQSRDYAVVPRHAGTFWYHAPFSVSEQIERGLYGALIVDEPEPVAVDQDLLLILDDWSRNAATPGMARDTSVLAANGQPAFDIPVRTNERLRLRLINATTSRLLPVRIAEHDVQVMAIDGQPTEPFIANAGRIALGPGNRADLYIDTIREPGSIAKVGVENDAGDEVEVARLRYHQTDRARAKPLSAADPLPANPLPARMDFTGAMRLEVAPDDRVPNSAWAAGVSGYGTPPLFTVKRGRTIAMACRNTSGFARAFHLHGHHFRLLDSLDDGWKPFWLDTVIVNSLQTARIAFVADQSGQWTIHCQGLGPERMRITAWFDVV